MKKRFIFLVGLFCVTNFLLAHGDVHERILVLSKEIKVHPDSASLYMLRGELYYEDGNYKSAIRDLKCCSRRGGRSNRLQYDFAQSYYKMGKTKRALRYLDKILITESLHVKALRLKGQVLMERGAFCEGAQVFEKLIETLEETIVENYLEAASAWEKCSDFDTMKKAEAILKKGISDLGPLLAFFNRLKKIALQQQDYEEAIRQQTYIIYYSIRKEKPYYERALLHSKVFSFEAVVEDLQQAKKLLTQLPIKFQKMEAMRNLRLEIETALLKFKGH